MAEERKSAKRYWPVILLAVLLAEKAHAPLMGGAAAADQPPQPQIKQSAEHTNAAPGDKQSEPAIAAAGNQNSSAQIDRPQQKDLFSPLPLPPSSSATTYPQIEGAPSDPIDLLHTGASDKSGVNTGASTGEPNPVLGEATPTTTDTPVAQNPVPAPVAADPGTPVNPINPSLGTTPATPVPEPSSVLLMVGAALLLGRRPFRV